MDDSAPGPPDDTIGHSQTPTMPGAAAPRTVLGPYVLLQKLGEGGMGEVWLAQQERPVRRRVALKLIKAGMDTAAVLARFDAERQALALMNHPCIARVFDAGSTEQGRPYFAMEHVDGEPITDYCDRQRLSTQERLELFIHVCEGVQHAHQKGVIHRDIKPSNVLVRVQDDRPAPKIIDFGLAKAFDHRLTERTLYTELGTVVGTPEYMSPEQAEMSGSDVDTRTDVYSMGVLLYVLLVGALPFDSAQLRKEGIEGIRKTIREQDPSKPSTRLRALGEHSTDAAQRRRTDPVTLRHLLRGDLDAIVMKAIEKDRTRRYDSASELAADIRRHVDNKPVLAAPPSFAYVAAKFVRRHRVGVAAAAGVAVVMIAATVVSTVLFFRAESARKEAEFRAYTASVAAAAAALDLNDAGAVRRHLESTAERLRGWEWNWLMAESDRSLATSLTLPPAKDGYRMRLSPDGKLVAVRQGGGRIAPVLVYDARDGKQLHEFPTWESFAIDLRFSPDNRFLGYSATSAASAQIWDLTSGKTLIPEEEVREYRSLLDFDAQGQHVALTRGVEAIVMRLADGAVVMRTAAPPGPVVVWGTFSPDGRLLALHFEDPGMVRVVAVPSGAVVRELRGTGPVTTCRFSPDGSQLAVLGISQLRLYDTGTWELRTPIDKLGSVGPMPGGDVAFLDVAGSAAIVGAGRDGVLRAFRPDSPNPRGEIRGEPSPTISIAWDEETGRVVTAHLRGVVRHWPAFPDWALSRSSSARPLLFLPPKGLLALGQVTRGEVPEAVSFFDLDERRPAGALFQFPVTNAHSNAIRDAALSPDRSQLAVASASGWEQGRLKVFDMATGFTVLAPEVFWGRDPRAVAWSPDGKRVAVVGNDGLARVFDPATGAFADLWGHRGTVEDVAFAADGSRVWTAGADATLRAWNPESGEMIDSFAAPDSAGITCLALFEDRRQLVCGLATGGLVVWDTRRREFGEVLDAHSDRVEEITRTPDGARVVSGALDGSVVFWDPDSWREVLARRLDGGLTGLAFSADGERLACGRTIVRVLDARPEERRVTERDARREASSAAIAWVDAMQSEKVAPAELLGKIQSSTVHGEPVKDAAAIEFFRRRAEEFRTAAANADTLARPHTQRQILRDLCISPGNDRFWLDLGDAAKEIGARPDLSDVERDVTAEYALAMRFDMHGVEEWNGEGVLTNLIARDVLQSPERVTGDHALALFAAEELVFAMPTDAGFRETLKLAQAKTGWPAKKDSLDALRATLGVGDPNGAYEMMSLAQRHWQRGNLGEAGRLLKKNLDWRIRVSGRHDRSVPNSLCLYADVLHASSRNDEAEKLLREACVLVREIRGEEHAEVAQRDVDLGHFLHETARGEEAEKLLRDAVDRSRRIQGADHPDLATALVALAETLCGRGAFAEAEPIAREGLAIRQRALTPTDWRVGEAMSVLGATVAGQGRYAEAEPLLVDGHANLDDLRGRGESRRAVSRHRIAELYRAMGKTDQEARWRAG